MVLAVPVVGVSEAVRAELRGTGVVDPVRDAGVVKTELGCGRINSFKDRQR
jgi:hypothetical protein